MVASKSSTRKFNFASLSPLAKLAVWIGAIALVAAVIQAVTWTGGLGFNILAAGGGGRGVLLGVAVATLLLMMAADSRPAAGYGLGIDRRWHRHLLGGLALGAMVYCTYGLFQVLLAACSLRSNVSASELTLCALYSAVTAFPVALTQQVIFSGYLLGMLRERSSRLTAVIVPALLFALLRHLGEPAALLSSETYPLLVGMFLVGSLLGAMRLMTGSVLLPASFLTGCIFMRRVFRTTSLLAPTALDNDLVRTLVPGSDPLQSPLVWLVLAAAIGAYCLLLLRHKEDPAPASATVDVGFLRVFPFSNISMLAPLDLWLGRLADARFRVGLKYVPRLLAIVTFSAINTVLSLPERLLAPLLLRWRRVPDPVFIVGVHRSGTTHLHNLLALDPQLCAPRVYQIMNPAGFFTCSWLVTPLLAAFLPWRRPMDAVRFHIFAPQEDEFAISGVSRLSPYWGLTFPRCGRAYDRFIFPDQFTPAELRSWRRHLMLFLRKLIFWSGNRPVLKNPYNTARVAALRAMFPGARFVHVFRHPYDVYRSNMHMVRQGHVVYQLQDPDESDSYQTRFLGHYRTMEEAFYRDVRDLPSGQVAELAFEDLEQDPIGQLRQIYARLGLEFTPRFQARLERYLESIADYQKNRFKPLADDARREVDAAIGPFMARWGYDANGRTQPGGLPKAA